jgi:O-antigen/teichoic acid export membrane protein
MSELLTLSSMANDRLHKSGPISPGADPGDRSKDRFRRAAWTGVTSIASRGASLLCTLASVPLTIGYLGTERFALWMTINSFVAMLAFADLGLGNGLLTAISESHGKDDTETIRKYISSAFFMLSGLAASILIALAITYKVIPWARLLGVHPGISYGEAAPSAAIFLACFACNLPLGVVQRIQMGLQKGYTNNTWAGLGVVLGFAGVLWCVYKRAGVPWLILSVALGPIVSTSLNSVHLFRSRPDLLPSSTDFQLPLLKKLLAVGFGFLILQIALGMAVGSDNIVIAHLLGPGAVAEYSIAMRIFTLAPVLLSMLITPLWPAYGESVARGDVSWAIRALKRSMLVAVGLTFITAVFLSVFGRWIIALWVGNRFHQSQWLLSGMGLWMVLNALAVVVSIFLNGLNRIHVQVLSAIAVGISTLMIELLATPKFGLPAIIWSTNISYICFIWIPIALFFPRFLNDLQRGRTPKIGEISAEPGLQVS